MGLHYVLLKVWAAGSVLDHALLNHEVRLVNSHQTLQSSEPSLDTSDIHNMLPLLKDELMALTRTQGWS